MTGNHIEDLEEDQDCPTLVPQYDTLLYSNDNHHHLSTSPTVCTTSSDDDATAISNDIGSLTTTTTVTPTNCYDQADTDTSMGGNFKTGSSSSTGTSSPTRASPTRASTSASGSASSVQVAVRVRPLLSSLESGCGSCIHVQPAEFTKYPTTIQIGPESTGPRFTFDEVFPTTTTQVQVFEHRIAPLVERCLEGYNATTLAYGQTGSGKTHSVIGPSTCHSAPEEPSAGIIPRAVSALFEKLRQKQLELSPPNNSSNKSFPNSPSNSNKTPPTTPNNKQDVTTFEFQVRVQFLEIYGEDIRDLLASSTNSTSRDERLTIRDIGNDEPEVVGATFQVVKSAEEALRCLTKGMLRRVTAATAMNESSSRSHAIFSILVDQQTTTTTTSTMGSPIRSPRNAATNTSAQQQQQQSKRSKFNFVDLAGSERQKRTRAEGMRLKEGIGINKGLLVLGNVISALGDPKKRGKAFVPYRDSKLTRLLKGSLGGNHKTLMIACVSPSSTNMEESLNCLRYANRAKNIQNRAVVNVDARTRMIAELKSQVCALATDYLRAKDTGDLVGGAFSRQDLVAIVEGAGAASGGGGGTPGKHNDEGKENNTPSPSRHPRLITPEPPHLSEQPKLQQLQDVEEELSRTTSRLKRCRTENFALEERLNVTRAEKEFYRLQLEAVAKPEDGTTPISIDQVFVNRAAEYEKEISQLKDELRIARSNVLEQRDPNSTFSIEKANQDMQEERRRLSAMQDGLLSSAKQLQQQQPETPRDAGEDGGDLDNSLDAADSEEKAEEDHLTALTLKYSQMDDEDEVMIVDQRNTPRVVEDPSLAPNDEPEGGKVAEQRRAQIEADLLEISRIIESKEELISQLQCSQAKYSSMKEFYEGKLFEMEQLLDQKEVERQKIIAEMERLKESNHDTKDLEEELKKKEEHIAGIRKQKLQLKDLTAVSSKNAAEIQKLQNDVRSMKERKVSMQKQLAEERKAHAQEIKRLKKEVLQKDRETRKWQKISNQKTSEAHKANQVAKMKVQQLGQLRAKYKDAEKTIRMLQIKKGVMAKAGLDSVIVGRRGKRPTNTKPQSRDPADAGRAVDADSLRDYFDKKVAEVGRKEALADKLARGWEEHMQLTLQRSELVEQDTEESKDEIQALDLRIQYEEDRIRKLAHRLGKRSPPVSGDEEQQTDNMNSFLYGKDFKELCKGCSPSKTSEIAAKVLFGMIVRERRRIASLAKTASALDEKLRECQMDNEAKEVAFRSYVQDSQQDFANISMNHQEQILSLMSLVKNGDDNTVDEARRGDSTAGSDTSSAESIESSKLLILANERIGVLEQQLRELKAENKVGESYRVEKEEFKAALATKTGEYEKLEVRVASLRSTLRQLREELMRGINNGASGHEDISANSICLAMIREALLDSTGPMSPMARRHSCPNIIHPESSPQARKQWEFIHGAADDEEEDADEEEAPDWADEIMEDLAFIAEGKLPPSLQGMDHIFDISIQQDEEKENEEKQAEPLPELEKYNDNPQHHVGSMSSPPENDEPHPVDDLDTLLADTLMVDTGSLLEETMGPTESTDSTSAQNGVINGRPATHSDDVLGEIRHSSSSKSGGSAKSHSSHDDVEGSVFDRLVDPTNFTGTQKERHHSHSDLQKEHQESSAERLLDSLLESNVDLFTPPPTHRISESSTSAGRNNSIEAGRKVKEYTRQNVFERLQKTTTQSFAGKHHEISHDVHPVPVQKSEAAKGTKVVHENRAKRATPQTSVHHASNVGESAPMTSRIPMPKIRSPARPKSIKPKPGSRGMSPTRVRSPGRAKSPSRTRKEQYTQQDVFERLTKTTTEAYAVKKRVVKN